MEESVVAILNDSAFTHNELRGPVGRPAAGNISPNQEKSPSVGVLIVDDEALIRWSLAETLADHGYSVLEAGDGKAAIALLENPDHGVQVVMLDYRLPDLTGLQVLAAIRSVSPKTHVIMMTAYGTPDVVAEAHRLGAVRIVNKPIEMADVAGLVRQASEGTPGAGCPPPS
jgi:two-component system, NtrC family, response regulator AtoC